MILSGGLAQDMRDVKTEIDDSFTELTQDMRDMKTESKEIRQEFHEAKHNMAVARQRIDQASRLR